MFPLYLFPITLDDPRTDAPGGRRPNLSPEFIAACEKAWKLKFIADGAGDLAATFGPEDVFHYMYAVFHSPEYRRRYSEFLKRDFPRLPLTSSGAQLTALCGLGRRLTRLHLMERAYIMQHQRLERYPLAELKVKGDNVVDDLRYGEPGVEHPGRVNINKRGQYFEPVPPEVWSFHVGGYQVCEKWLKDRKARQERESKKPIPLDHHDAEHYGMIVSILAETIDLMAAVDQAINAHGGWPLG